MGTRPQAVQLFFGILWPRLFFSDKITFMIGYRTSISNIGLLFIVAVSVIVSPHIFLAYRAGAPSAIFESESGAVFEVAPAFYVAKNGSDANPGTLAQPFASLTRARDAMRASDAIKTAYLRDGIYNISQMLSLGAADNGQTWSSYPGEKAILDGAEQVFSSPTNIAIFLIQGGSNITINGLDIRNFHGSAINIHGGPAYFDILVNGRHTLDATGPAFSNVISNNTIHDGNGNEAGYYWHSGIGAFGDVQNTVISNNAVYNLTSKGIELTLLQMGPLNGLSNSVIENNFVQNVNIGNNDAGGIYAIDRTRSSTGVRIVNNYIRDYGAGNDATKGIYLDDDMSNTIVTGNIVAGKGQFPIQYHIGGNNRVSGNIFDLATDGSKSTVLIQAAKSGNSFTGNIILSSYTGPGSYGYLEVPEVDARSVAPIIRDNLYWNYAGGTTRSDGNTFNDINPVRADPFISCWSYQMAPGSPALLNPVRFQPLAGAWGPPGFQVTQTGTVPSSPHSAPCRTP